MDNMQISLILFVVMILCCGFLGIKEGIRLQNQRSADPEYSKYLRLRQKFYGNK